MELVVSMPQVAQQLTGINCVSVPGWAVVVVAGFLSAPRVLNTYFKNNSGGN